MVKTNIHVDYLQVEPKNYTDELEAGRFYR
ncbi:hypothetical protein AMBR_KLALICIF_01663 [Latilactobacillus sakei]|nr:hypothetical protein AMBR_KLALICIF_01663 [Latilactobacillus sakei]